MTVWSRTCDIQSDVLLLAILGSLAVGTIHNIKIKAPWMSTTNPTDMTRVPHSTFRPKPSTWMEENNPILISACDTCCVLSFSQECTHVPACKSKRNGTLRSFRLTRDPKIGNVRSLWANLFEPAMKKKLHPMEFRLAQHTKARRFSGSFPFVRGKWKKQTVRHWKQFDAKLKQAVCPRDSAITVWNSSLKQIHCHAESEVLVFGWYWLLLPQSTKQDSVNHGRCKGTNPQRDWYLTAVKTPCKIPMTHTLSHIKRPESCS